MVENVVLGVALFDISHDVQYLAIVWLYNCRRVNSNPNIGKFMKFVFRRGMVLFYLALIATYGAIGLVPSLVQSETVKTVFTGFLWTSTILHYYMDGFIWKVRESSTRATFGLNESAAIAAKSNSPSVSGFAHLMKWSPLILFLGWLFMSDVDGSTLSASRKKELQRQYTEQLSLSNSLPTDEMEQSWLYTRFKQIQNIAASVPKDRSAQTRAAIMLANFGRHDEAAVIFEKQLTLDPTYSQAYLMLGGIHVKKGNLDAAMGAFEKALSYSKNVDERTRANFGIGETYLLKKEFELAKAKFAEAIKDNPELEASIDAMHKRNETGKVSQQ
jgi:tetratricopeptide (TPR) repeat protein